MQLWRIFVMIRKLLNRDIDRVADIWLKTNLKAHYFISNQYWKSNYELVKEILDEATGEKEYTMLWKRKQKSEFGGCE